MLRHDSSTDNDDQETEDQFINLNDLLEKGQERESPCVLESHIISNHTPQKCKTHKIIIAEAVESDENVTEDEGKKDQRAINNLAMKNFAEQMTQHISDHMPDHIDDHMRNLPLSENLELNSSDLSETIGQLHSGNGHLNGLGSLHLPQETDNDSDEPQRQENSSIPIRSIHPSQLVSHPSQLGTPNSGSLQQLLQDQFPRLNPPTHMMLLFPPKMNDDVQAPIALYSNQELMVNSNPSEVQQFPVDSASTISTPQNLSRSPKGCPTTIRNRKKRWRPSGEQRDMLEKCWSQNQYPDQEQKMLIAKELGDGDITYKQVTSWFKHKRENDKAKGKFTYKYAPAVKFTNEQINLLEQVFSKEPYAKGKTLQDLALRLDVTDKRIQNWFKHKRSRLAQQGKFEYKPRNTLNFDQISFLKGAFCTNPVPTQDVCEQIGLELNVRSEQIVRWFASERSRKRQREEQEKTGEMSGSETDDDNEQLEWEIISQTKCESAKKKVKRKNSPINKRSLSIRTNFFTKYSISH